MKKEINMELEKMVEWSAGNPGAAAFLMNIYKQSDMIAFPILHKLEKLKSIRGTNLYVLYSDLCNKDMGNVLKLLVKFTSRLFSVMGEREESIFKQVGFILTTILGAIKAIYDYLTIS